MPYSPDFRKIIAAPRCLQPSVGRRRYPLHYPAGKGSPPACLDPSRRQRIARPLVAGVGQIIPPRSVVEYVVIGIAAIDLAAPDAASLLGKGSLDLLHNDGIFALGNTQGAGSVAGPRADVMGDMQQGVSAEAAERINGLKKQAMAKAAEELLAGTGWLPPLLVDAGHRSRTNEGIAGAA